MAKKKVSAKENAKAEAERAAATGLPPSPVDDLTDHSRSAGEIAKMVDPKSGATANAQSIDAVAANAEAEEEARKEAEKGTLVDKIRKSELFLVHNHSTGENYVGISPQNDPDATTAEKRLSAVFPLDTVSPRTGMIVKPKDGPAFTVGQGFGPDSTPRDWSAINTPDGKPLFA